MHKSLLFVFVFLLFIQVKLPEKESNSELTTPKMNTFTKLQRNPPDISVLIWFFTFALERDHKQQLCNLYRRPANLKITITFIGNISSNQSLVSKMFPLIISGKKALQLSIISFCKKKVQ